MGFPKKVRRGLRRGCDEKGQSIVELAMVILAFFLILFGIFEFGITAYTFHFVSNAAREGARLAIVHGAKSDSPLTDGNELKANLGIPPGIDPDRLTVTAEWPGIAGDEDCPANSNNPGCPVKITILYDYDFIMPFIPSPAIQMTSSSQMTIAH